MHPLPGTRCAVLQGMAKRRPASELVTALPIEQWQCIATHMDLKTWCRTAAPRPSEASAFACPTTACCGSLQRLRCLHELAACNAHALHVHLDHAAVQPMTDAALPLFQAGPLLKVLRTNLTLTCAARSASRTWSSIMLRSISRSSLTPCGASSPCRRSP